MWILGPRRCRTQIEIKFYGLEFYQIEKESYGLEFCQIEDELPLLPLLEQLQTKFLVLPSPKNPWTKPNTKPKTNTWLDRISLACSFRRLGCFSSSKIFSSTGVAATSPERWRETTPTLSSTCSSFVAITWSFRRLGSSLLLGNEIERYKLDFLGRNQALETWFLCLRGQISTSAATLSWNQV